MNGGAWVAMCILISNLWAVHDKWFPAALWLLGAIVMFIMERAAAALAGDGSGQAQVSSMDADRGGERSDGVGEVQRGE